MRQHVIGINSDLTTRWVHRLVYSAVVGEEGVGRFMGAAQYVAPEHRKRAATVMAARAKQIHTVNAWEDAEEIPSDQAAYMRGCAPYGTLISNKKKSKHCRLNNCVHCYARRVRDLLNRMPSWMQHDPYDVLVMTVQLRELALINAIVRTGQLKHLTQTVRDRGARAMATWDNITSLRASRLLVSYDEDHNHRYHFRCVFFKRNMRENVLEVLGNDTRLNENAQYEYFPNMPARRALKLFQYNPDQLKVGGFLAEKIACWNARCRWLIVSQ